MCERRGSFVGAVGAAGRIILSSWLDERAEQTTPAQWRLIFTYGEVAVALL